MANFLQLYKANFEMAFVPSTSLSLSSPLGSSKIGVSSITPVSPINTVKSSARFYARSGYGSYSYNTDLSRGHTNQHLNVTVNSDTVTKRPAGYDPDSSARPSTYSSVSVPSEGIPQAVSPALASSSSSGEEEPPTKRGAKPAPSALSQFRAMMAESRLANLDELDARAKYRRDRLRTGLDETYMLTMAGQLDFRYVVTEKIPTSSTGSASSSSVSALDFLPREDNDTPFYKAKGNVSDPFNIKTRSS